MTRAEAEQLLLMADRLWAGGAPGRGYRVARVLEEWEGEHGFRDGQLELEPNGDHESTLPPEHPGRRTRSSDPGTSGEAARSVQDLPHRQQAVLWALDRLGGRATDDRLVAHYQANRSPLNRDGRDDGRAWPKQSQSGLRTRRHELVVAGFVEDSGERAQISTGRRAIVWRRTDKR